MFKKFSSLIMLVLLFLGVSGAYCQESVPKTSDDFIKLADAAFEDKDMDLEKRKENMELMIQAAEKWPDNYDIQWRAAQAIHVYGDTLYFQYQVENYKKALANNKIKRVKDVMKRSQALTSEQSTTLLNLGIKDRKYADKANQLNPKGVDGHYYNAAAIGLYAFGKSIIKALLEGLGPKYEEHIDISLEIEKNYRDGYLYSAYGRYWYKLPWPKRNNKRSLEYLLKAVELNPQDPQKLDYLADTYYALKRYDEALTTWNKVLETTKKTYHSNYIKELVRAKLKYMK